MQLNSLKDSLRNQLADGQTPSVLTYLQTILAHNSEHFQTVIIRSSNLKTLENQYNNGVISSKNYEVAIAVITDVVLKLIDDLKQEDLKKTDISELEKQIAVLKLAPLGKIKLVDCDRDVPYTDFKKAYRSILKSPSQFYFVTAQAADQPAHFAERVIYEIIGNTLKGSDQAINFPRRICKFTAQERVDVLELPFDDFGSLLDNQGLFRAHFAERMKRFQQEMVSIEDFVAGNTQRLPYRFFTFLFRIDFDKWGWMPELTEYLTWIAQTFKANLSQDPLMTFQFMFIISSTKTKVNDNKDIQTGIEHILAQVNTPDVQPAVWLKNFAPVSAIDLEAWFLKLTNDEFQKQIKRIIEETTVGLDHPELPTMSDLEELFLTVYNVSQRI